MDRNNQTGFTLIELLITVVVLGILLALGAPNLFSVLETRRLKGAGESVMADLQFAKAESIKRNSPVILSFVNGASDTWCYGLAVNAACDCTTANSCSIDGIEKVVNGTDFDGPSLTASFAGGTATQTGFDPVRGFAKNLVGSTSNGNVLLQLSGHDVKVILSRFGRVRICSTTGAGGYDPCT